MAIEWMQTKYGGWKASPVPGYQLLVWYDGLRAKSDEGSPWRASTTQGKLKARFEDSEQAKAAAERASVKFAMELYNAVIRD